MIQISKKILIIMIGCISTLTFASTEQDNPFRKVARDVTPAVVQIDTVYKTKVQTGKNPFDFFFNNGQEDSEKEPEYKEYESKGLGSGIIVESDGNIKYVLTNHHVIKDAEELTIHIVDGREYEATIVGSDSRKDLALLKFETKDSVTVAKLGDSDDLYIGDWALAIGSPLGYESSVTIGIISAIGRTAQNTGLEADFTDYIQTDAAINRGNSGGALVNIDGEIIGINTWIASQTGGSIGLGFSIPINNAKKVISELIDTGNVEYGWLGVSMGSVPEEILETLKNKNQDGAFVHSLFKDSPADKSGLSPGDIIIGVNGKIIKTSDDLLKSVGNLPVGKIAQFKLIRNGKNMTINVYPELRTEASQNALLWPGINSINLTSEIIDAMNEQLEKKIKSNTKGIIVISVANESVAKLTGLVMGDIITTVDGDNIKNTAEFYNSISKAEEEVTLNVIRNGQKIKLILLNE